MPHYTLVFKYSLCPELSDVRSIQFTFYIKDLFIITLLEISHPIPNSGVSILLRIGDLANGEAATSLTLVHDRALPLVGEGVRPRPCPPCQAAPAPPLLGEGVRTAAEARPYLHHVCRQRVRRLQL
jgi:hypothetical protein